MKSLFRWIAVVVVLGMVVIQWQARERRDELMDLRDSLVEARGVATECQQTLAIAEADFRVLDQRVDSLRSVVDTLESLDPRGVPGERYEEYLGIVDEYNDEVTRWETDAESLQRSEEACRILVDRYNSLADSLRAGPATTP